MKFRNFLENFVKPNFNFFNEAAEEIIPKMPVPISQSVMNLISRLPELESVGLQWVYTEGLRKALIGRRELAKIASEALGREISQDEVFSKEAHKRYPDLGELYDSKLEDLWFQKYEPKFIQLTSKKGANIDDINELLENEGFRKFKFGGRDGLIEFIEGGEGWSPLRSLKTRHKKHGIDLMLPEESDGIIRDEVTGKKIYNFGLGNPEENEFGQREVMGGFRPPVSGEAWKDAFNRAKFHSWKKLRKILSGEEQPTAEEENVSRIARELHQTGGLQERDVEKSLLKKYDIDQSVSRAIDIEDVNDYNTIKDALRFGLQEKIYKQVEKKGKDLTFSNITLKNSDTPEERAEKLDKVVDQFTNDEKRTIRGRINKQWIGSKSPTKQPVAELINLGLKGKGIDPEVDKEFSTPFKHAHLPRLAITSIFFSYHC